MRIANVIEEGKLGGPQVRMVRVAAALEGRAETLIVMPKANSGAFQQLCDEAGVAYRSIGLTRITRERRAALAYILFSWIEVLQLARIFQREGVNLVHASGGSWQYKAVLAARLSKRPVVWHLNDTSNPSWVRGLFNYVQPLADGFIFASNRSRDYYVYTGRTRPHAVVPSTVDPEHFDPNKTYEGDDEAIAAWGEDAVIGTIANVTPGKGLETLIRATRQLMREGRSVRSVIVGAVYRNQRAHYKQLKDLTAELGIDNVEFVGAHSDVRPILSRLDVYVCSSLAESSPVSVWEAMAMARPIVSTDVGDVALHVRDGESGFIVPVGDAAAMAERVGQLLDDKELRERMGAAARSEAVSSFAPAVIADRTLDIYNRIYEASPRVAGGCMLTHMRTS